MNPETFPLVYCTCPALVILNTTPLSSPVEEADMLNPEDVCTPSISNTSNKLDVAFIDTDTSAVNPRTPAAAKAKPVTLAADD